MTEYRVARSGDIRWKVIPGRMELFRSFDRLMEAGRVVKDLRHKKMLECRSGEATFLVKVYKARNLLRKLKARILGSRARHELEMWRGLERLGLPAVPVVAIGEHGAEGYVVCEKLHGWDQLQKVLLSRETPARRRRRLIGDYGRFARRLHDAGVWQYDFNPSNILVRAGTPEFKVIDYEKMELRGRLSESVRLRSISKINRMAGLSRQDRQRFLEGYLHADERPRLREIYEQLDRYVRDQSRRDALKASENCVRENRHFASFDFGDVRGWYRKRYDDVPGLTLDEVRAVASGRDGARPLVPVPEALAAWKGAHERGERPLAVIVRKGSSTGFIVR